MVGARASSSWLPRSVAALLALALLAALATVIAPSAQAVTTPSVSGRVTTADGSPIAGATVVFLSREDDGWWGRGETTTDADGRYVRGGMVASDDYVVQLRATGFASEFWGGSYTRDTATRFAVAAGQAVTDIDGELEVAASVSGVITTGSGPAPGVDVKAVRLDGPKPVTISGSSTAMDGTYTVTGLPAGTYTLRLSGGVAHYPQQYLGGTVQYANATTFVLDVGQNITGRSDLVVDVPAGGGSISGTVTDESGEPLEGASVTVTDADASSIDGVVGEAVYTDEDGTFTFPALVPGRYDVSFAKFGYANEYWKDAVVVYGDAASYAARTPLVVEAGDAHTGINASLERGIRVAVTVRASDGSPVVGADVATVLVEDGDVAERTPAGKTDEDGRLVLTHLADGRYAIEVEGGSPQLRKQYGGGTSDLSGAQTFRVDMGYAEPTLFYAALDGVVGGTIRTPNGQPALGAEVTLVKLYNLGWGPVTSEEVDGPQPVDAQGRYSFSNLPHGYTIRVDAPGFPTQYLGGASAAATAEYFALDPAYPRTDVDLTLRSVDDLDPVASVTNIVLSTDTRTYGTTSTATATVTSSIGPGTGTVVFKDVYETVLATAQLADGQATVTIPGDLTPGTHGISAHYLGSGDLKPSQTIARVLHISKASSATTLSLAASKRAYGLSNRATVRVTSAGGVPSGAVVLKDGTRTVGTATLVGGKATVALPRTLAVRAHDLRVEYLGSGSFLPSASSTQRLTVTKATATTSAKAKKSTVSTRAHARIKVTVRAAGVTPGGRVTVSLDGKVLRKATLRGGKATVRLPVLKHGKHKLTVRYTGSAKVRPDATKVRLKVVR